MAEQQKATEGFGIQTLERSAELAAVAVAAAAKAEVESAFVMAIKSPRNEADARAKILGACTNPIFATKARYSKPQGMKQVNGRWEQQFVVGPSIRFAEEMLRCWKNVLTQTTAIFDDSTRRIIKVTVRDLEANLAYSKEITLEKTVERRNAKDRIIVGQRVNSSNEIVYIVAATEDELANKEASAISKIIRNNGLRLIPQHIVEESMLAVGQMIKDRVTKDPQAEKTAILDGLTKKGVMPSDVERYIGCPAAQFTPDTLVQLRDVLTSIEDGHTTWAEYIEGTKVEISVELAAKSQPETKGAAILEKIGKAEPAKSEVKEPEKPKPLEQKPIQAKKAQEPKPVSAPAKQAEQPAKSGLRTIEEGEWADILAYLDEDPMRSWIRANVKERGKLGSLRELQNPERAQFLILIQDEAKRENVPMEQFIK